MTDFEAIIRTYMEERLKESHPEVGLSGTVLSDLYINPLIEVMKPVIMLLNRVDLLQSLYNANEMTTEELDNIGLGNYGVPRIAGSRASGHVYVEMEPQYVGPDAVVIAQLTVESSDGLRFISSGNTIVKYSDDNVITMEGTVVPGLALDYLNVSTGNYEFPVYVEAEEAGAAYNVAANTIATLVTSYPLLTGVVTNKNAFGGGVATESNESYAARIKQVHISRAVGTNAWYKNHILTTFLGAHDVYVAGYGDPIMARDVVVTRGADGFKEKHIGGKVDLYIRGSDIQTYTQSSYVYSDKIRLLNPYLKEESAVVINNITNPENGDLATDIIYEFPATKTGYVDVVVTAGISGVLPSPGDELEIRYISYLDDSYTDTFVYIQRFYYKSNKIRLLGMPFKSIVGITNTTTNTEISLDNTFEIARALPVIETNICPDQTGCNLSELKLSATSRLAEEGYYINHTVEIVSGTGAGQVRTITAYSANTGVAAVAIPWNVKPTSASSYRITDHTNDNECSARDTLDIVCDMDSLIPGTVDYNFSQDDLLVLKYTYNKLVADVQYESDVEEVRAIAADILAREAIPVYLYIAIKVKCKYGRLLTNDQKLLIHSLVEDTIVGVTFNSSLQISDLISTFYQMGEITTFMDYIAMPPVFFSSNEVLTYTDSELLALTGPEYCRSNISFENACYPVLAKCVIVDAD